ncbi:hypothetical protein NQ315_002341 [Exocentrus adspersus]|uniref:Uncharacterized protein n=1 Tax=Exocentrus adspersus TaxID=1586481 RepID=A0AAV8VSW9_9CUCU|nr:hypothetical protein NQ315_002341 [Exocentrus adspersus]
MLPIIKTDGTIVLIVCPSSLYYSGTSRVGKGKSFHVFKLYFVELFNLKTLDVTLPCYVFYQDLMVLFPVSLERFKLTKLTIFLVKRCDSSVTRIGNTGNAEKTVERRGI